MQSLRIDVATPIEGRAVLELFKPITWFPPMWAFACGVVSAGGAFRWEIAALGVVVAGPLVCGTSQAVNDWFDRHVDAINEPHRPIPSGRIPGRWGLALAVVGTVVALLAAVPLGVWGWLATGAALVMAWAYSAPPLRFKQNGWLGNASVGLCYEGLAWVTGAAVVLGGTAPSAEILTLALLYSLGAHGIMTLNDYKSIEGDRRLGIRSLPAALGRVRAARVARVAMIAPQLVVVGLLFSWGAPVAGWVVAGLVAIQLWMLTRLVGDATAERALWVSAYGVPAFVTGMMISAHTLRALA